MRFGYGTGRWELPGSADAMEQAAVAERLGYDHITWADQSLLNRDCYVGLTAWALGTTRIRIGTGVTHFATRSPVGTANAAATLQELSGGRMLLGLGTGMSGVHSVGGRPSTLPTLGESIEVIRRLTAGSSATWQGAELRSEWASQPVPVYVAAMGPRTQTLAGRLADGAFVNTIPPALVASALDNIETGATRAGRSSGDIDVWFRTMVVLDDDRERAQAAAASYAATLAHDFSTACLLRDTPEARRARRDLPQSLQDACLAVHAAYDIAHHERPDAPHSAPAEVVDAFTLAGDVDHVGERLEELRSLGVTGLSIFSATPGAEEKLRFLERFAKAFL